jgi:hypothetical protein
MDRVRQFLNDVKQRDLAPGKFLGLLNVLIGRRVALADGTLISSGLTYRQVASYLKLVRWEPDTVTEVGIDPKTLPPRDRERYWYQAIVQARVDSPQATAAGDTLAADLQAAGYQVGPAPGGAGS